MYSLTKAPNCLRNHRIVLNRPESNERTDKPETAGGLTEANRLLPQKYFTEKGVTVKQGFASVSNVNQKSNLTLVRAVAFLMFLISSRLPDTDYRDDDADDCHYNTGKFQNHSEHQ